MSSARPSANPATPPDAAPFTPLGEGDYFHRLAASPGVAVVLFTNPGCGACRVWAALLPRALGGIAESLFSVDVVEATGLARAFGLFHLPAVFLYRDGVFHARLDCPARPQTIRETATRLLAAPAEDEP